MIVKDKTNKMLKLVVLLTKDPNRNDGLLATVLSFFVSIEVIYKKKYIKDIMMAI